MLGIGVTATDTEIGKTVVSGALAAAMRHRGYKTGVYKPAASGCVKNSDGKLISTDAEFLLHCAGLNVEKHDQVVPYVLEAALAPASCWYKNRSVCNAGRSKGDAFGQSNQYS